jgi:hypothetical protein
VNTKTPTKPRPGVKQLPRLIRQASPETRHGGCVAALTRRTSILVVALKLTDRLARQTARAIILLSSKPTGGKTGLYIEQMTVALGVNCKMDQVLLAVARDGEIVDGLTEKLPAPALLEQTERLQAMLDDLAIVLAEVKPDAVRILMPEQTYDDLYGRIAPRVTLETLVRLACDRAEVPVEMLYRSSARARLGMPRGGKFAAHIPSTVGAPVGKYWNAGRNLAAAAALADRNDDG